MLFAQNPILFGAGVRDATVGQLDVALGRSSAIIAKFTPRVFGNTLQESFVNEKNRLQDRWESYRPYEAIAPR